MLCGLRLQSSQPTTHGPVGSSGTGFCARPPCSAPGKRSLLSEMYIWSAAIICRVLLMHEIDSARHRARLRAGSSIAARIAMMAMTTSSSISVKAVVEWAESVPFLILVGAW